MSMSPMHGLAQAIRQHALVRFIERCARTYPDTHLKDLVVDYLGPDRAMEVNGRRVINFGSDSFLGLDQDRRVQEAIERGVRRWGTHNGASRMFASVRANEVAEEKLASWLGADATLIYPSVSLANLSALPALVSKRDLLVIDEHSHHSIQEGAKLAQADGVRVELFRHSDPADLQRVFAKAGEFRIAVVALDGVYSMTGALPPLAELNDVCLRHRAVLYVDDAHATGVMGAQGRGTVLDALGNYDNALVVGSLSKGFSCLGAFVGCTREFKRLLKMGSSAFMFGGPVPPPYLDAICAVCEILSSSEYATIHGRLMDNVDQLTRGAAELGLVVLGGQTPIVSILVGDEDVTFQSGRFLFERGFYVQSVTFPAVPYHAGVLRIQVNANHASEVMTGLVSALAELKQKFALPMTSPNTVRAAA